jgi:hypothetical protein
MLRHAASRALTRVANSAWITHANSRPTEVHVLVAPSRPPKQVVSAVISVAATLHIHIDRIVSVVVIADEEVRMIVDDEAEVPRTAAASRAFASRQAAPTT